MLQFLETFFWYYVEVYIATRQREFGHFENKFDFRNKTLCTFVNVDILYKTSFSHVRVLFRDIAIPLHYLHIYLL